MNALNRASSLETLPVPFRADLTKTSVATQVSGKIPEWLSGQLVRTAVAGFSGENWQAQHWFDGLGLLYSFRFSKGGAVEFAQRQLDSVYSKAPQEYMGFGTGSRRGRIKSLVKPVANSFDNTNVNVLPFGKDLVALTEGPVQWVIDRETLKASHHVKWTDREKDMLLLAHPHADFERKKIVNLSVTFGSASSVRLVEHDFDGRERTVLAQYQVKKMPYIHAFGLTPKNVVLIHHPFEVSPLSLLFTKKGYIDNFDWTPGQGTKLVLLNRSDNSQRIVQAASMFVFHVINAFEDGRDTLLDVVAYDDPSIIATFSTDSLKKGVPFLTPRPTRLRIRPGADTATSEPLSSVGFEFPNIDYRRHNGKPYQAAWGARIWQEGTVSRSEVLRLDLNSGDVKKFDEPNLIYGEPVFVAKPNGVSNEGVVLTVGTALDGSHSRLSLLDAQDMTLSAQVRVEVTIPLGFHGSFS